METNTPHFRKFVFIENEKRADIFDLQGEPDPLIFHYFRLSKPRKPFLIKQGARYVIESWNGHEKTSFTGLIPAIDNNWYFGDLLLKRVDKTPAKSFLIAVFSLNLITLYVFPNFTLYPGKRLEFCRKFRANL